MAKLFVPQPATSNTMLDEGPRAGDAGAEDRSLDRQSRVTAGAPLPGSYEHWYVVVRLERCAVDIAALLGLLGNHERLEGGEADLARRMLRRIKQSLRSQYLANVHPGAYDSLTDLERRYHDTIRAAYATLKSKVHTVPGPAWARDLASALSIIDAAVHQVRHEGTLSSRSSVRDS